MHKRDDFIRAICETPDDDHLRLIFCDWLEEQDDVADHHRALFIRTNLELHQTPMCDHVRHVEADPHPDCRCCQLVEIDNWFKTNTEGVAPPRWRPDEWYLEGGVDWAGWYWRRGFPYRITLRSDDFVRSAGMIFHRNPIEEVLLTDKLGGSWDFWVPNPPPTRYLYDEDETTEEPTGENIPHPIFEIMWEWVTSGRFPAYHSTGAQDVGSRYIQCSGATERNLLLSNGCVEYGRRKAGLPSLYPVPVG